MANLQNTGRVFYGIAIAGTGFPVVFYNALPYMLFPPQHFGVPGPGIATYITGILFILIGACIVFQIKIRLASLLFGWILLLIFCFYHIPYQFMVNSNYRHLVEWDNALKELALAGGAFVIAGTLSESNDNTVNGFWRKPMFYGAILFSIPIICFGILHFLYAKDVSTLVPSWIPIPVFWTYLAGTALIGSGMAIIFKIKPGLIAALLGIMIFIWFIMLHIPRVINSPIADLGGEVTSAFLALAYSGTAFVLAVPQKKLV